MKQFTKYSVTGLFTLLLSCFSFVAFAQEGEPYLTKSFSVNDPAAVNVRTSGGSIKVNGGNSDEVLVRMYVKKNGVSWFGSDDVEEALEDYQIDIRQEGNTIYAEAKKENGNWNWNNGVSISFVLEVPYATSTDLNTSGGSIHLSRLEGEHEVKTSGGSLNFDEITGYVNARTSGGSIKINNFSGTVDGKTSGGSIRALNASGELELHTSGGSIVLEEVSGSIDAHTSGGSIRAFVKELDQYLTLKTSGGSVKAVIPEGLGVDLDLSGNRVNTRLSNFTGEFEKDKIEGSMNGGGIPVTLKTSGGSVNLEYHQEAGR